MAPPSVLLFAIAVLTVSLGYATDQDQPDNDVASVVQMTNLPNAHEQEDQSTMTIHSNIIKEAGATEKRSTIDESSCPAMGNCYLPPVISPIMAYPPLSSASPAGYPVSMQDCQGAEGKSMTTNVPIIVKKRGHHDGVAHQIADSIFNLISCYRCFHLCDEDEDDCCIFGSDDYDSDRDDHVCCCFCKDD